MVLCEIENCIKLVTVYSSVDAQQCELQYQGV